LRPCGGDPFRGRDRQDPLDLPWIRERFLPTPGETFAADGWPFIVHGHTFRSRDSGYHGGDPPTWRLNLDGGIYRGGHILAWIVEENRVVGVRQGKRQVEENP
jgi:hypothetical protein